MILELIRNLQKLGFTGNEAKIYATLVCQKPARASEIAEAAEVPRPKIYGILRGMAKKGYVKIIEGEPTLFTCLDPDELIIRIRSDFMHSLDETSFQLHTLEPGAAAQDIRKSQKIEIRC